MSEDVSRREFIKVAGAAIGGLAIGAIGGYSLMPSKETIVEADKPVEVEKEVPAWPWNYVKLDSGAAMDRAYAAFFQGGCCYGVFEGVIGELREKVGFPYNTIPTRMAVFGKGGIMGWGSTCGVLTGGGMAMNLVTSEASVVNELMGWYTETALPQYTPAVATKVEGELPTSVSNSPLCHASVTQWCNRADKKENSPERAERCGRLVADTVGKIVGMLNDLHDEAFTASFAVPDNVIGCNACHGPEGNINNVMSKMDCVDCHTDAPHDSS